MTAGKGQRKEATFDLPLQKSRGLGSALDAGLLSGVRCIEQNGIPIYESFYMFLKVSLMMFFSYVLC